MRKGSEIQGFPSGSRSGTGTSFEESRTSLLRRWSQLKVSVRTVRVCERT